MAQVKCSKCNHINPEGVTQCQKCNIPLPAIKISPLTAETKKAERPPHEQQTPNFQQGTLHRGEIFGKRYTVVKLIGRGGMGSIYKVFDNTLREEVALKLLLPQFAKDPMIVDRFLNEARIARKLSHPNIVRVHDIGIAGNILYISMEYIEGKSLRGILESMLPGQRLPLKQVLTYFDQLCSALEYAHQFTVHRDIKPENVMVTSQNTVKLMDFGISKLMADTRLTGVSVVMGTPFYMPPEQVRNSRDVDARSDIYSCGIMLYEILTGQIPTGIPKPASELVKELPPELDKIVERCIQTDPKDRFQSSSELRKAIEPLKNLVLSGDEISISHPTKRISKWKTLLTPQVIGWSLITMVLLLSSAGLFFAEQYRDQLFAQTVNPGGNTVVLNDNQASTVDTYIRILFRVAEKAKERASTDNEAQQYLSWSEPLLNQVRAKVNARETVPLDLLFSCARYLSAIFCEHEGMILVPEGYATWNNQQYLVPAFFIDINEVTYEKYKNFCTSSSITWELPPSSGLETNADAQNRLPVTMVNYYDALAYASYYNKNLPTVWQWLRAGQGDRKTMYPWGDIWKENSTNVGGVNNTPLPIQSYPDDRSPMGCFDMLGNVSEWTSTPAHSNCHQEDITCPRLIMGGDFSSLQTPLNKERQADPETRSPLIGFRCVKEIPISPSTLMEYLR